MFEQLTERLQGIVRTLRGSVSIDADTLDAVSRDLRLALLEADVNFGVVKDFLARVREQALGESVLISLTPGQQVIKIVRDELTALLGGDLTPLRLDGSPPLVLLLVGLQGSGKTTTLAKLGHHLRRKGRFPLLASVDVHRPAAREQLAQLAATAELTVFSGPQADPVSLAEAALRPAPAGQCR